MLPAPFTPEFLNRLEALRLRTRKEVLGNRPGAYAAPRRGTSLEFADYRKYSPGDDLRYVDWGIFARSDRLYVRLFREEVDLFAYVFIDASRSMACPSPAEKFAPACRVADAPVSGDLRLIDSESGAALNVYWGEAARRESRGRLERHNRELKSFCHQSGVHYSLYAAGTDLSEYVLTALPAMGLFR